VSEVRSAAKECIASGKSEIDRRDIQWEWEWDSSNIFIPLGYVGYYCKGQTRTQTAEVIKSSR